MLVKRGNLINSWRIFHGGVSKMHYGYDSFVFKTLKQSKKLRLAPNEVTHTCQHVHLCGIVCEEQKEGKKKR